MPGGVVSDAASEEGARQGVIAQRLNRLFETRQPLGRAYTLAEVVDGVNHAAGHNLMSVQYLSQLRNGTRAEPSYSRLAAIARFFGVSVEYFSDEDTFRRSDQELRLLAALEDSGVRHLALCAAGLSEDSLAMVTALIEKVRRSEGLPDQPEASDRSLTAPL
jgi:transcriptional regulator with XRE-family HTH domain